MGCPLSPSHHLLPATCLSPNLNRGHGEPPCWFSPFLGFSRQPWGAHFLAGGPGVTPSSQCCWFLGASTRRAPGKKAAGSSPPAWAQPGAHSLQHFLKGWIFFLIYCCFPVFTFRPACALPQAPPNSPRVLLSVMPVSGQRCSPGLWQGLVQGLHRAGSCYSSSSYFIHAWICTWAGAGWAFFFKWQSGALSHGTLKLQGGGQRRCQRSKAAGCGCGAATQ